MKTKRRTITKHTIHHLCIPMTQISAGHPPFNMTKTIVFDSLHAQGLKTFSCRQQRLWSHLVGTQADLSLHWEWEYTLYCCFPYRVAP